MNSLDSPVVETSAGRVRGRRRGVACVFLGVPYGASTAGPARHAPPRPPRPWPGVRDAARLGDRAAGLGYPPLLMPEEGVDLDGTAPGDDCLVLNVWTPAIGPAGRRPVMVWLHGGAYTAGSGGSTRYDGSRLAERQDVVVVTLNHRLGAIGFLYLAGVGGERWAQTANLGLQDIVLALGWVRDNIAAFGGDPGNVTLFGESGGAGKLSCLMAMPSAHGLFHRAIAQSGSAVRVATPEAATQLACGVLERLGLGLAQLHRLPALPTAQLAAATPPAIGPVVDGTELPRQPFDPDAPALAARVPLLIGSTLTEITFFNDTPLDPIDEAALLNRLSRHTGLQAGAVAGLLALYRADQPEAERHLLYQRIASDWWITAVAHLQAERQAARSGAPVFVYQFAMPQGARGGRLNVPHTAEIAYVFDNLERSAALVGDATPDHQRLADQVSAAWAAFARNGRPEAPGLPAWPAYEASGRAVMVLDGSPRLAPASLAAQQAAIQRLKAASN